MLKDGQYEASPKYLRNIVDEHIKQFTDRLKTLGWRRLVMICMMFSTDGPSGLPSLMVVVFPVNAENPISCPIPPTRNPLQDILL
jgi:hypothetical protein